MDTPPNLSSLSNAQLLKSRPLSDRFIECGCQDFHDACHWLHQLPYGKNSRSGDIEVLFEDQCGTCTTKHGVAAALAHELSLPIFKYIVFYRLDESIRRGARETLSSYNLEYVPTTHCLLGDSGQFVDLTWDNQTGKRKNLTEFEIYIKSEAVHTPAEHDKLKLWGYEAFQRIDPKLARFEPSQINEIAARTIENSQSCNC